MRTPAVLLILAALAACSTRENPVYSSDELAEFMGTREERAARAPYSPPGWPLKRGDVISMRRQSELNRKFPGFCGRDAKNAFWVGDMVFGTSWTTSPRVSDVYGGNFIDARMAWIAAGNDPEDEPVLLYRGHFRAYAASDCEPPRHVRDPSGWAAVLAGVRYTGIDRYNEEMWTEERWLDGYVGEGR